jgi:hypothetical protein
VRTRREIEDHRDLRASLMWRIAQEGRLLHGKRPPTTVECAASGRPVPTQADREKAKVRFAQQWMKLASEGIGVARAVSKGSDELLTGAAFHCEQSAVKALSACLCRHDVRFDQARTLAILLELCMAIDPSFSALDAEAVCLRPFFARYTYVVGQPDVERDEFDRALAAAERVYGFVLAKHPELDPEKA